MMRSRPARLTVCTLALLALCAAVISSIYTQSQIAARETAFLLFERTARDAADALQDVQAGQQAYVAPGQDSREWMTKVSAYLKTLTSALEGLKPATHNPASKVALQDASNAVASIAAIDKRLRTQIGIGEMHQAAEIVFTEAGDTIAAAKADVESAIDTERQLAAMFSDDKQRTQRYALVAAVALGVFALAVIGILPSSVTDKLFGAPAEEIAPEMAAPRPGLDLGAAAALLDARLERPFSVSLPTEVLTSLSAMCTEFGRVRNADELRPLLEDAAELIGARGLIVWLGDVTGGDLRPVLAHGYSDTTLARLSTVSRHADNAAAIAYRSGDVQVVTSRPGGSLGTVVAPLLSTDGCIGALTAEIQERGDESAEETRALAVIIASQLASVLSAAAAVTVAPPVADIQADAAAG